MLHEIPIKQHILIALTSLLMCIGCMDKTDNCSNQKYKSNSVNDTVINNIALVKVDSGWFLKGLNCESKAIDYSYWIGKYEITNTQYFQFLNEAIKQNKVFISNNKLLCKYVGDAIIPTDTYRVKYPDHAIYFDESNQLKLNEEYAEHPVIGVTWFGAKTFCDFYGFDLPSIDEWEKAARGSNCTRFPWGDQIDSTYANYANSQNPFQPGTTPVGFYDGTTHQNFKTNNAVSSYGCYDMAGNAWEWTRDKFDSKTPYYCGKGGGFNLHTPAHLQVYYISTFRVNEQHPPLDRTHLSDGFRVVKHIRN